MPFFEPLPSPSEPVADGGQVFFDHPWQKPEHWLPALGGSGIVLARTDTTALFLTVDEVYPRGLSLDLQARVHPDHLADGGLFWHHHPLSDPREALRFGLEWPDGSRAVADSVRSPDEGGDRPTLSMAGGGGGGLSWSWRMWLTPLPAPGPVIVHVLWESRGIPETAIPWDLTEVVKSAGRAVELWPLPTPSAEGGWFAYAPLGGTTHVAAARYEGQGES